MEGSGCCRSVRVTGRDEVVESNSTLLVRAGGDVAAKHCPDLGGLLIVWRGLAALRRLGRSLGRSVALGPKYVSELLLGALCGLQGCSCDVGPEGVGGHSVATTAVRTNMPLDGSILECVSEAPAALEFAARSAHADPILLQETAEQTKAVHDLSGHEIRTSSGRTGRDGDFAVVARPLLADLRGHGGFLVEAQDTARLQQPEQALGAAVSNDGQ
mmetsp:Transcript_95416/g.309211  ORF Transcript_95416/g.309211 Transcript_95416/m.309211 type:complete len:215 (-) Transcript_95416:324-968(-)